ncbi:MAG: hypothetical protein H6703_11735 [Myxococcales bacterium]|nr:hypothetical protein [Myxococcales bacterium]MCB9553774.1 hypothetical protein [Myxococcales bacterium]
MAYVDTSTAHALDEEFDGILSALTLTGGLAPPEEIARYLGSRDAADAFIATCYRRRFGRIWSPADVRRLFGRLGPAPLPRVDVFIARNQVMWTLVGDPLGEHDQGDGRDAGGVTGALYRFMYALATGRTMLPLMVEARVGGYAAGSAGRAALMAADEALGTAAGVYFERDATGTTLVTPWMLSWSVGFAALWAALPWLAVAVGAPLRWRWLVGSPVEAARAGALRAALADEWPVAVEVEVFEVAASRYLVDAAQWPALGLDPGPLPAAGWPRWVVRPDR